MAEPVGGPLRTPGRAGQAGGIRLPRARIHLALVAGSVVRGKRPHSRDAYQRAVLRALIAVGFANLVVLIFNQHYFRARPFEEHEIILLFYQPTDSSFPSNPAAVAFAMASGMWQGSRKLGLLLYGLAALWGLSRIFAGVFYPSDVVAGALIGVSISYLVGVALRLIEPIPTLVLRVSRTLHLA